ncbi:MAG TPA: biotin transporter BioY [Nitrospirae bacterium]|nr:biotin transporter BioY [Nitrospirota bacterium]
MNTVVLRPVLVDFIIKGRESYNHIIIAFLGSMLIALSAQIAIPLPFTPVPITGQTLGVLVVGTMLGAKRGALSAIFYIIEAVMGLPVFAGFKGGFHHLLGPTGGYIIGFVPAAYIVGYFAQRGWDRNPLKAVMSILAGNLVIYIFGLSVLSIYVGRESLLQLGFYPFVVGDLIKITLFALSIPLIWKGINNR